MKKTFKKTVALLTGIISVFSAVTLPAPETRITADCASNLLAFPGAVGAGKYATGGRGGEVYHVTNLNDSGEGSFRDAVSKSGRIVVFDVSGTIELKSNILCQSNVTIAGQTAPGGSGITLKNYKMGMSGDNIICRYISSRPGPYKATSSGNDAWGGAKGSNSIIDHCSMSWTTDEQWGLYSNNEYYTVQYSIIGPADSWGGHAKGLHGFGLMMGKGYSTFDHNLIIHNVSRNFRGKVEGTETADFTNNIIYNWAYQMAYGTIGHLNYVGNTLKMGNGTTGGKHYVNVDSSTKPQNFKIFLKGNRMLNKDNSIYDPVTSNNWSGITVKQSITDTYGVTVDSLKSDKSFQTTVNGENVSTADTCESAEASYEHVISYAGNGIAPDKRTAVDQQCAYETKTGTGNLSGTASYDEATDANKTNIDKYKMQCGVTYTYPSAVLNKEIVDTDNDGMPDDWELARGLNPNDPSDYKGDYCGQGYMNIEYYINDLTVDSFPEGVVTLSPETSTVSGISAFETIEAEDFTSQEGIKTEDCTEGGLNVGYIENGDYMMFRNIDFEDGAKSFSARLAGGTGNIEIYVDSLENKPSAVLEFNGSGNWQKWVDAVCNTETITGRHNIYLKFTGGEGFLFNINNFVFGKEYVSLNGNLIKNLTVYDTANISDWKICPSATNSTLMYGDRVFTYTALPEMLVNAESVRPANDSKMFAGNQAVFTAGDDIAVYIALDTRVTPDKWLDSYENTNVSFTTDADVTYNVYKKNFKAGEEVTLGHNADVNATCNYGVFVVKDSGTSYVKGDANADGVFNVADAVMLQNWILGAGELTDWKTVDMDGNDIIDVFDLTLLRKYLIENK